VATRYVNARIGRGSGPFTDPAKPARTVAAAVKAAAAGDTVEVQGAGTYAEAELVIDKALTLVSSYALANPNFDPTAAGFRLQALPELTVRGGAKHRVLRIIGTPATRETIGPIRVRGFRVSGGHAMHGPSDPALGAGGGIAIVDADDVRIERCAIINNRTETMPLPPWPEADRLALRTALVELIGEVVSPFGVHVVNNLIDTANRVLDLLGRRLLPRVDRARVLADVARDFDAMLPSGRPNSWLAGQAFGGGVATVWASPFLRNCLIRGNVAEGRGAGLAVVGYGWPRIEGCWLDQNRSGEKGRRDGGGIGCEISLPGKMPRNLSEADLARFLASKIAVVKATIGSPWSSLSASDLISLVSGSGSGPIMRGLKAVLLELIDGRTSEAARHALYYLAGSALNRYRWDAWKETEIQLARANRVAISECRFTHNRSTDDGGGLYASVLSRVRIAQSDFSENLAGGCGGAVRLSMGSGGEISQCVMTGNTAHVDDPQRKLVAGGGAVAARNADLELVGTRIGRTANGVAGDSNVCSDHAGGGIAFQADTEGSLAGIPDLWTTIMREVFGVSALIVTIRSDCSIRGNGTGYDDARHPLGATRKAKGGGIWAIQTNFPDAPRLRLKIESAFYIVTGNQAQTTGYTSAVARGLHVASAHEICLQDMLNSREWSDDFRRHLDSAGNLLFTP
jgi:hypothetical protein